MVIDLPDMVCTIYRAICNNDQTLELASRILSNVNKLDYMIENTKRCGKGLGAQVVERGGNRGQRGQKGHLELGWSWDLSAFLMNLQYDQSHFS